MSKKEAWVWVLLGVWLTAMLIGLWLLQDGTKQPFLIEPVAKFNEAQLRDRASTLALADRIRVIAIKREGCMCSTVADRHWDKIVAGAASDVQFDNAWLSESGDAANDLAAQLLALGFPASAPAALVVSANGELAYHGPLSTGAGCYSAEGIFVDQAIDRAQGKSGSVNASFNWFELGCYCQ